MGIIKKKERGQFIVAVPLICGERILGVLEGIREGSGSHAFKKPEVALLDSLSLPIASALANAVRSNGSKSGAVKDCELPSAEAETLRKDAEALKAEYEAKTKSADKEAGTIVERARQEAEAIITQAKQNAEALVERRQRMAEDKIAAEERHALDQLRATAADAARAAAARLIRERFDAKSDETLVGDAIRSIGSR